MYVTMYTCCKPAGEGVPPVAVEGLRQRPLLRRQGPLGLALPPLRPPQRRHDDERNAGEIKRTSRQEALALPKQQQQPALQRSSPQTTCLEKTWCSVPEQSCGTTSGSAVACWLCSAPIAQWHAGRQVISRLAFFF